MASSARSVWLAPFAICCLLLVALLIASTIIIALIPLYLSTRNVDTVAAPGDTLLTAGYASDAADGRSLTLANTGSVSRQLAGSSGLSTNVLSIDTANFAAVTASSRKRRQSSNGSSISCERATGLTGDIFAAQYRVKYPADCVLTSCKRRFLARVQNALRMQYRTVTIVMNFTTGEVRNVRLVFCGFFSLSSSTCAAETRSNMYLMGTNNTLYQFNPSTFNLTSLGRLSCSNNTGDVYSIAVQRSGIIWALFTDGKLYRYSIGLKQCSATTFAANQSSVFVFTMTFLRNVADNSERFVINKQNGRPNALGLINLNTLSLTTINTFSNLSSYGDLAGTADGRLFSVIDTDSYTIARIDPTNATTLDRYPLNISVKGAYATYAFATVNTQFYFFEGNGNYTDIYIFDPATNTTTTRSRIPQVIYSATASSCLGT